MYGSEGVNKTAASDANQANRAHAIQAQIIWLLTLYSSVSSRNQKGHGAIYHWGLYLSSTPGT